MTLNRFFIGFLITNLIWFFVFIFTCIIWIIISKIYNRLKYKTTIKNKISDLFLQLDIFDKYCMDYYLLHVIICCYIISILIYLKIFY